MSSTQRFDPRQNMRSQTFEIFHYQDSRPDSVEMHHHDFYEVYFFLSGDAEYRVEGRIYRLESGDLLLINPLELHQPMAQPGSVCERFVLWINKAYLESLSAGEVSLSRCFDTGLPTHTNLLHPSNAQRADIMTRLSALVRESYGGDYGSNIYAQGLLIQFMVELNRIAMRRNADGLNGGETEEDSSLVSRVAEYIGEHYSDDLTLDGLARRFFVSKYHLSHEFSRVVGTSVYRYIMLKRLLNARQMLSEGMAPGVVFASCGFGDYANFYRAFKSKYGISPRDCMSMERQE